MADSNLVNLTQRTTIDGSDQDYGVHSGTTDYRRYAGYNNLLPEGYMINGKLSVTVSSNNITVALKTKSGGNPSATDPVSVWINGSFRACTAALSVTKNAGTNWFNSGGTELATKEIDYFAYLLWNTTPATDIMDIGFARYPGGRVYSDFSGTTTNEKYLAFANASTPTSTDSCVVVGRFAATLSATAAFNWSVPTYTNSNLIQFPIYETRWLTWAPAYSASGSLTFTAVTTTFARYKMILDRAMAEIRATGTLGGTASDTLYATLPFESSLLATGVPMLGAGFTANVAAVMFLNASTPDRIAFSKYDLSNYATSGSCTVSGVGTYET